MRSIRPRRSIVALALVASAIALAAGLVAAQERGDDSARASKNGLTQGKIGSADVKITYGRPNVKSRQIWDALVPYGDVWRAPLDAANFHPEWSVERRLRRRATVTAESLRAVAGNRRDDAGCADLPNEMVGLFGDVQVPG